MIQINQGLVPLFWSDAQGLYDLDLLKLMATNG